MPWIPHLMVLDDDPRVLESLVPGFVQELGRGLSQTREVAALLRRGPAKDPANRGPVRIKVTAHGFESDRVDVVPLPVAARGPPPPRPRAGRRVRPGAEAPEPAALRRRRLRPAILRRRRRPAGRPALRRRGGAGPPRGPGPPLLGLSPARRLPGRPVRPQGGRGSGPTTWPSRSSAPSSATWPTRPSRAFAEAIGDRGSSTSPTPSARSLAQLFDLARLIGTGREPAATSARARRPLPCLLIDGESGTGKRGLAELFHAASDRRDAPLVVASCSELTNETLLRSILFGHKRGAFTDAREDRPGLVAAAGQGASCCSTTSTDCRPACSAILHSFLEDGEYGRLGEEEVRRQAECAVVLTVETGPWQERRRSGELPLAFLARVERLPLTVPPLRERPEDIEAQARWLARALGRRAGGRGRAGRRGGRAAPRSSPSPRATAASSGTSSSGPSTGTIARPTP